MIQAADILDLSYDEALALYQTAHEWPLEDVAALGRLDRFFLLSHLLKRPDAVHPWIYARCREVEKDPDGHLDLWAREHYKAVTLDEPVPTPTGYRPHGALQPGDWVFGADGNPVQVVARTPVFHDADCYRVTFDDGYAVTVSGAHLWEVERKTRKRKPGVRLYREKAVMSTADMAQLSHAQDDRLAVPVAPAVFQIEHLLDVPPYTLGAWLGDGTSANSTITCAYADMELIEHIRSFGHVVTERKTSNVNSGLFTIDPGVRGQKGTGLASTLREMGLIGNKHIPRDYLVASIRQRRELLQGLMDTDGHCSTRGTASFVNKSRRLAEDVFDLCASLGLKPRFNVFTADHGEVFYVSFQAYKHDQPFRLARKLARCRDGQRAARRFVVSVTPVESVPVSCIQVAAADGLYLIGRHHVTTHNSTVITFAGIIQEILRDPEITIGIFSFNKNTARKFLRQIKYELESNKLLHALYPTILWTDPQKEAPRWSEDGGIVVKRAGNPKEATVEGHGLVDGQPTGAHFLLRVYDDVVTLESVTSPEMVAKTTEAWSLSDNLGARGPTGMARAWHIGTRYSFADTYQTILDMGAVKPRIYPATHNGLPDGEPVFLPPQVWADKRKKQIASVLAAQMLQNPAAGNQAIFRKAWLRFADIRPATLNVYILCDPASSKKKGSDRTAIPVIGVDAGGNRWLLDGYHHRMSLSERYQAIKGLRKTWLNMPGVQSVAVGYERYGSTSDLEYFEEAMRRDRDAFALVELAWPREGPGSKIDRVQRLEPDFREGRFYLAAVTPQETKRQAEMRAKGQGFRVFTPTRRRDENGNLYSLNKNFIEEFLVFPFGAHDDLIDASSRIFDIDAAPPIIIDESELEPPAFGD